MTYKKLTNHPSPIELPLVQRVVAAGRSRSVDTYLVGGFLRDLLWKGRPRDAKDLDFAVVGATAISFAKQLADELSGHFVPLDPVFDTARVVFDDGSFLDFSGCVGGTIEADLQRRDFTVNALAFDASHPDCVLDVVGGLDDIEKRQIRAVSKSILEDDPLRIVRAFRFKAILEADIESQTLTWIKELNGALQSIACERINTEMFTLLNSPNAGAVIEEMGSVGVLEEIYPELRETRRVTPNQYHHLNLFDHSVEAVKELELSLTKVPDWVIESNSEMLSFGITRLAATKLAALLHDIGKPATWEINEDGRHTFYSHDNVGAEMAEVMAERMKWSKPVTKFIAKLIKMHLRPGALFHQGRPTPRAVHRFYRKSGADLPELMILAYGDLGATCGEGLPLESRLDLSDQYLHLLNGFKTFVDRKLDINRLLTGEDVMRILSVPPGKIIGEILEALSEAQAISEVLDRPSAEQFVIEYHAKKYSS